MDGAENIDGRKLGRGCDPVGEDLLLFGGVEWKLLEFPEETHLGAHGVGNVVPQGILHDFIRAQGHGIGDAFLDLRLEFLDGLHEGGGVCEYLFKVFGHVEAIHFRKIFAGGLDWIGEDIVLHRVQPVHVEMLDVELVLRFPDCALGIGADPFRKVLEHDLDSSLPLEGLHLGDIFVALGRVDSVRVDADFGDVTQGHDGALDLRFDVFGAVQGEFRRAAGALFEGGAGEGVAVDVAELRKKRLDIVVGRHYLAGVLRIGEAGIHETEQGLLAVAHLVVVRLKNVLDGRREVPCHAVAGAGGRISLELVEKLVKPFSRRRLGIAEGGLELVGDARRAVEEPVEVGAAAVVDLQGRR